ncbi:MAG: hypothetical protein BWY28_03265 [bacterium ADurb.Bin236]|nr:MAG: hypothetical protein BWY28_03265 [bacterium ADurb.Bin236]HOY62770.1 hypothetical protein [bacterium]HPN95347.1 hypothetical protein [bacterium]
MSEYKMGYIDIYKSGAGEFMGGALITDRLGIPIEFRHTEPVSPTKVQQILYGRALEKFVKTETLAKCLLGDLKNKPDLLVVADADYYPLTRMFNFPFVQLGKAAREPMEKHGDYAEVSESEIHLQALSHREPLRVRVDRKNAPTLPAIKSILTDVTRTMDVLEPLSRVQEALKALVAEKI